MAIAKYGIDSFQQFLYGGIPIELLDIFEQELISRLNTLSPNGYNLNTGGSFKKIFSEETRDKMRLAKLGKIQSEESNIKRSLALKGKPLRIEHRLKIATALIGNLNGKGHSHIPSAETRLKMSLAKKGKPNNRWKAQREYKKEYQNDLF
jgi:hypothetical protein